jgi:hypothetical protein
MSPNSPSEEALEVLTLLHHMQTQQGLSSAVSTTETNTEQHQEQHPFASAPTTSTSSSVSQAQNLQAPSGPSIPTQQGIFSSASAPTATNPSTSISVSQAQICQDLAGSDVFLQLIRQRHSLSNAMSATESNIQQLLPQLSVAPASDVLLQLIRQRQGLSNEMSATESNIQQLLMQFSVVPARNAYTSSPDIQDQILQGLGGPGLLQLLLLRIQSQQGLASVAPATASNPQLQLPVAWALNASTSSSSSQEQFLHGLSGPGFLQEITQNIQSQQGLSSTVVATDSDMHLQQCKQDDLIVSRPAPSIQGGRADARAAASDPPSLPSSGIIMGLPDDKHQLSEYQIVVRLHLEIFEAKMEDVKSNIQGRKRRVFLGQAGIRCRHCSNLMLRQRGRGAVYYPVKLSGMYQAAQNMASSHLSDCCTQIPPSIKQRLRDLRHRRETASGGKEYWAKAGRAIGLYETEDGLRLFPGSVP